MIILGSQSPRRKEILNFFHLPFTQLPSGFDEESVPFHGDPDAFAKEISEGKSRWFQERHPNDIIVTADSVVYCEGKHFAKPRDEEEAFSFLSFLAGKWHEVHTGVTVYSPQGSYTDAECTRVLFNPLTPSQIRTYQKTAHCYDKAGGYTIQHVGSLIVARIEGCYYNVTGLPVNTLARLLKQVGIDLWRYLHS